MQADLGQSEATRATTALGKKVDTKGDEDEEVRNRLDEIGFKVGWTLVERSVALFKATGALSSLHDVSHTLLTRSADCAVWPKTNLGSLQPRRRRSPPRQHRSRPRQNPTSSTSSSSSARTSGSHCTRNRSTTCAQTTAACTFSSTTRLRRWPRSAPSRARGRPRRKSSGS